MTCKDKSNRPLTQCYACAIRETCTRSGHPVVARRLARRLAAAALSRPASRFSAASRRRWARVVAAQEPERVVQLGLW